MTELANARPIDRLLAEYGESHRNPTNKKVHWIAVPVIVWTVLALLWSLPVPDAFAAVPMLNWATVVMALSLVYYVYLSIPLTVGMAIYTLLSLAVILAVEATVPFPLWQVALTLFVVAWIAQFWGHKIEGAKPSFFKDIQYLLIGPAWLLHFLYRKAGIAY